MSPIWAVVTSRSTASRLSSQHLILAHKLIFALRELYSAVQQPMYIPRAFPPKERDHDRIRTCRFP